MTGGATNLLSKAEAAKLLQDAGASEQLADAIVKTDRNLGSYLDGEIAAARIACGILIAQICRNDITGIEAICATLDDVALGFKNRPSEEVFVDGVQHFCGAKLAADLRRDLSGRTA